MRMKLRTTAIIAATVCTLAAAPTAHGQVGAAAAAGQAASSVGGQISSVGGDAARLYIENDFNNLPDAANTVSSNTGCPMPEAGLGLEPGTIAAQSSVVGAFTGLFNPCQESDQAHYTVRRVATIIGIPTAIVALIALGLANAGFIPGVRLPALQLPQLP